MRNRWTQELVVRCDGVSPRPKARKHRWKSLPVPAARWIAPLTVGLGVALSLLGLLPEPARAQECVVFEWAVAPGTWDGSGDNDPANLLMDDETRWEFFLNNCSLSSGQCDTFGDSASLSFQDGTERDEWYSTSTTPTIGALGNDVTYSFSVVNAFVPLVGQPRFEDLDWSLTATLPSTPADSPSAADLSAATSLSVTIAHDVDNTFFTIDFTGSSTETVFTSCTPQPAVLSVDDVSLSEGDAGTAPLTFTLSRDHNDDDVSVTVDSADGTASAGADYTAIVGSVVNFSAGGALTQMVSLDILGDEVVELDETLTLVLSNPVNASIGDGVGEGTLINDDSATLAIDDVSLVEGDAGENTAFDFTVSLDAEVDTSVDVDFSTSDQTAENESGDGDYLAASGTLNFSGNASETQTATVDVVGDSRSERDETFFVDLAGVVASGRNVVLADDQGVGTIVNDDEACPGYELYQQPFDSATDLVGHPTDPAGAATWEGVVDGGGAVSELPPSVEASGVRLWGFGFDEGLAAGCSLDPDTPFDVVFAADNAGQPGAVLAQRTGLVGSLTAEGDRTRVDLVFDPVDTTGISWISVQRATVDGCAFRWLAETTPGTYDDQVVTATLSPNDAYLCVGQPVVFRDGFETGDTSAWSAALP